MKSIIFLYLLSVTILGFSQDQFNFIGTWNLYEQFEIRGYPMQQKEIIPLENKHYSLTFRSDGTCFYGDDDIIHYFYLIDYDSGSIYTSKRKEDLKKRTYRFNIINSNFLALIMDLLPSAESYMLTVSVMTRSN